MNESNNAVIAVAPHIQIPVDEFELTFARSGGPGGQNVNKVNSKAVLRWRITGSPSVPTSVRERFIEKYPSRVTTDGDVILTSQKHRDQGSNIEDCFEKLRSLLAAVAFRPIERRATKPTLGSKLRRVEGKRETSKKKQQRRSPDVSD